MSGLSVHDRKLLQEAVDSANAAATETAHTRGIVETLVKGSDELFSRMRAAEKDIARVETRQGDCGARKSYVAGTMPGNKSESKAVFWAMFSGVVAVSAVLGSCLSPLAKAILERILP